VTGGAKSGFLRFFF